jgi:polysaccharide export outer membrane protein
MHRRSRPLRVSLAWGALLWGLGGLAPAGAQTSPAPAAAPAKADPGTDSKKNFIYKLTNTDRLRIVVFGEPDLSTISRIDARGNVNLYLVGDVPVAGCTVHQAQQIIESAYRDGRYLRNPQVTISVEDYAPRMVTVDGQVKNPGAISLPTESTLTVYQAIIRAGGFTDIAKGSAVSVTRILPDGTKKLFSVDVDSLIKGKDRARGNDDTLLLEPGDIIYVPERLI